jgi:hypothetical protein
MRRSPFIHSSISALFYRGISEREANAIWKRRCTIRRWRNSSQSLRRAAPQPQLKRMHNYMLAVGVHDANEAPDQ